MIAYKNMETAKKMLEIETTLNDIPIRKCFLVGHTRNLWIDEKVESALNCLILIIVITHKTCISGQRDSIVWLVIVIL